MEIFHSLELTEADLESDFFGGAAYSDEENLIRVINEAIEAVFIETLELSTDEELRELLQYLLNFADLSKELEVVLESRTIFAPSGEINLEGSTSTVVYENNYVSNDYNDSTY